MPRTARILLGTALVTALSLPGATLAAQDLVPGDPATVGVSAARLQDLSDRISRYVQEGRLPGAVLLVARRGRIVHHDAVGWRDIEAAERMRPDDLFRIASQTKALVSVGVMMLEEQGLLRITDPVGDYLPEWSATTVADPVGEDRWRAVAARRPITIRDLLTHTAGVDYGYGPASEAWVEAGIQGWYFADRDEPIRQTVREMAALPMAEQPGERFVYGFATDILGALVEVRSGLSLRAFLLSHILLPLGMEDTDFWVPPGKRDRLATVYGLLPDGLVRLPEGPGMRAQGEYARRIPVSLSGGAGLVSTAGDYARFLQMLLNGGELDGVRILSESTVRRMTADAIGPAYGTPGMGFGLGFRVVTDADLTEAPDSDGEFGWGGAYHSTYWVDPVEELVVVYLTQVVPAGGLDDYEAVREGVHDALIAPR